MQEEYFNAGILWLNKFNSGHFNRNIFKLRSSEWSDGSYIDKIYKGRWNRDLWYGRMEMANISHPLLSIRSSHRKYYSRSVASRGLWSPVTGLTNFY